MRCCRVVFQMRFLVCRFRAIGVRLTLSVRLLVVVLICIWFLVDVAGLGWRLGYGLVGHSKVLSCCCSLDFPGWIVVGRLLHLRGTVPGSVRQNVPRGTPLLIRGKVYALKGNAPDTKVPALFVGR